MKIKLYFIFAARQNCNKNRRAVEDYLQASDMEGQTWTVLSQKNN